MDSVWLVSFLVVVAALAAIATFSALKFLAKMKAKGEILVLQIGGWFFTAVGFALMVILFVEQGQRGTTAVGFPALCLSMGALGLSLVPVYRRIAKVQDDLEALRKTLGPDCT